MSEYVINAQYPNGHSEVVFRATKAQSPSEALDDYLSWLSRAGSDIPNTVQMDAAGEVATTPNGVELSAFIRELNIAENGCVDSCSLTRT
jgi:hypothetical protein